MKDVADRPAFGARSFRAKFIIVVGIAVLFDLLLSSGLALWNVQRLSRDATVQVGDGLTGATQEYLRTYAIETAERANLLIDQVHSEVNTLAGALEADPAPRTADGPRPNDRRGEPKIGFGRL